MIKKEQLEITKDTKELQLTIGKKIIYIGSVHSSVGIEVDIKSSNEEVIKIYGGAKTYHNKLIPGHTGGDSATRTFTLEAMQKGESAITIQKVFRGEVENEQKVHCTVTE